MFPNKPRDRYMNQINEEAEKATGYYNGACPVCSLEIGRYQAEALDSDAALDWVDISKPENADCLAEHGINQDTAYRRMTVIDAKGTPRIGVDGFIEIWRRLPRWRWAAWLFSKPVIYQISSFTYDHIAARMIYAWNKRRLKRAA